MSSLTHDALLLRASIVPPENGAGTVVEKGSGGEERKKSLKGLDLSAIMGYCSKQEVIEELFPVTLQDSRTGRQYWHERVDVAKAVAKELFDKCSQPTPTDENAGSDTAALTRRRHMSDVQMSMRRLMTHPVITGDKHGRVDVDDVLSLFMKHWQVGGRRGRESPETEERRGCLISRGQSRCGNVTRHSTRDTGGTFRDRVSTSLRYAKMALFLKVFSVDTRDRHGVKLALALKHAK